MFDILPAQAVIMLKIVWTDEILKTLLDACSPLVEDIRLTFTQDGLSVGVVDASHVCFVSITIPSELFTSYEVEGKVVIPLELAKLVAMQKLSKKQPLTMIWGDEKTDKGLVRFEVGGLVREATLLHADMVRNIDTPDINPPTKFQMKAESFILGISAISDVSDILRLGLKEGIPLMTSTSTGDSVTYTITDDVEVFESSNEEVKTQLSCTYLKHMSKGFGQHTTVFVGNDFPLRVESNNNGCSLVWMLAPRIDNQ